MLVRRRNPSNIFKDVIVCTTCWYVLGTTNIYITYCISVLSSTNLINKNPSVILKGPMSLGRYNILWFRNKRNKYRKLFMLVIDLNV